MALEFEKAGYTPYRGVYGFHDCFPHLRPEKPVSAPKLPEEKKPAVDPETKLRWLQLKHGLQEEPPTGLPIDTEPPEIKAVRFCWEPGGACYACLTKDDSINCTWAETPAETAAAIPK